MHLCQIVFIALLGFQYRAESITIKNTKWSLLCCREISKNCYSKFSLAFHYNERLRLGHKTFKRPYGCLQQLLLIISGTVEINPGPINLKFPCGNCNGAVKKKDNSIACDSCNKWYHKDCLSMGDQVFNCYTKNENLDWICTNCALNDISYTLFDSSFSSIESDAPTCNIQRKKSEKSSNFSYELPKLMEQAHTARTLSERQKYRHRDWF